MASRFTRLAVGLSVSAAAAGIPASAGAQTVTQTFESDASDNFGPVGNPNTGGLSIGFSDTNDNDSFGSGAGEAGGTFSRITTINGYAHTGLPLSRDGNLSLSGNFTITADNDFDGTMGVGFFNTNDLGIAGGFVGVAIREPGAEFGPVTFRGAAEIRNAGAGPNPSGASPFLPVEPFTDYSFDVTYDPSTNTISGTIAGVAVTATAPDTGDPLDAFGVVSLPAGSDVPTFTAAAFFDDLTYSVPEPAGLALLGVAGLISSRRRRRA